MTEVRKEGKTEEGSKGRKEGKGRREGRKEITRTENRKETTSASFVRDLHQSGDRSAMDQNRSHSIGSTELNSITLK